MVEKRSFLHQIPWKRVWIAKKSKTEEEHWEPQKSDRTAEIYSQTERQQSKSRSSLQFQPQFPYGEGKPKPLHPGKPGGLWDRLVDLGMGHTLHRQQTITPVWGFDVTVNFPAQQTSNIQDNPSFPIPQRAVARHHHERGPPDWCTQGVLKIRSNHCFRCLEIGGCTK
jgi:hypothetical protein